VINLHQADTLVLLTGTARWYAPFDCQLESVTARLGTAANGPVEARINKNGASLFVSNITAGNTVANSTISSTLTAGDYLTVDVIKIGTSVAPGRDLYVQIMYTYQT
jgi:hypothetical protein